MSTGLIDERIKAPFKVEEEDYSWLGFDQLPTNVVNPLDNYELEGDNPPKEIIRFLRNPDYLHFTVKNLLGIELLPFQCVILENLWTRAFPLLIATRGGSKSTLLAIYCMIRLIFNQGCNIVIVGGSFRQSREVWSKMYDIWEDSPILKDICNNKRDGPKREIDRCEFRIGNSICYSIPLGSGDKIRGLRANYILADEFSSIDQDVFSTVVQGFGAVESSPVEKVKQAAIVDQLEKENLWDDNLQMALDSSQLTSNQIVYAGTASWQFNHFYTYYKRWREIIEAQGDEEKLSKILDEDPKKAKGFNWRDFVVMRIPYTSLPRGFLAENIISQAKATLHTGHFLQEYGCVFLKDTNGFFKRSTIEAATTNKTIITRNGHQVRFTPKKFGDKDKKYVIGIDPAADQDNAAIVVLELGEDHRKIVYTWTINSKKFKEVKKKAKTQGLDIADNYYYYIASKIRELISTFPTERILMDKHGGGTAIAECLKDTKNLQPDEYPIFEVIDPDNPKPEDQEEGLHMLELIVPTPDLNSDANHGMLKDLEEKELLFPGFDNVELEKSYHLDHLNPSIGDTYEDVVHEIEELKNELTTIVVTQTSKLGKEHFDTPQVKESNTGEGKLRKDRYSALLYANYYLRNKDSQDAMVIKYKPVGGSQATKKSSNVHGSSSGMYSGPGVAKFGQSSWVKNPKVTYRKNR